MREFPEALVRDVSLAIYKDRLGEIDTVSMLAKDNDGGKLIAERSRSYDTLTLAYLRAINSRGQT